MCRPVQIAPASEWPQVGLRAVITTDLAATGRKWIGQGTLVARLPWLPFESGEVTIGQ